MSPKKSRRASSRAVSLLSADKSNPILYGAVAVVGTLLALTLGFQPATAWWSLLPWTMAWAAPLCYAYQLDGKKRREASAVEEESWEWVAVCVLLAAAFAFRLYKLTDFPFNLHNDEMRLGLEAKRLLDHPDRYSPYSYGWADFANAGYFPMRFTLSVFGENLFAHRFASVWLGVLTLLGTYLLVRAWFNRTTAILLLALDVVSPWHLHFSRIGGNFMPAVLITVWGLYFFARAQRSGARVWYAASGAAVALSQIAYHPARLLPCLLLVWGAEQAWRRPAKRPELLEGFGWIALVTAIFLLPFLRGFEDVPRYFAGRPATLSIFSARNVSMVFKTFRTENWLVILAEQAWHSLSFVYRKADSAEIFQLPAGVIAPLLWPFFAAGLILALIRFRQPAWQYVLFWIGATLVLGGVIQIDCPYTPRLTTISSILPIFAAAALAEIWERRGRLAERYRPWLAGALALYLIGVWYRDTTRYWIDYPNSQRGIRIYAVARWLAAHPNVRFGICLGSESQPFSHESVQFLAPGFRGVNTTGSPPADRLRAAEELFQLSPSEPVLLVFDDEVQSFEWRARYRIVDELRDPKSGGVLLLAFHR